MSTTLQTRAPQRGFAMIFALLVVVLLLLVGLAMLANSQNASDNAANAEAKTLAADAAEAGLNDAIDKLNKSSASATNVPGTLQNQATYSYTIKPNYLGTNGNGTDCNGAAMTIPSGYAYVQSNGSGPGGTFQRSSCIEAIVSAAGVAAQFPHDAIDAQLDIQGHWNHKQGITACHAGSNDANVHANGNITAGVGFFQGTATATGNTDKLNSSAGGVNQPAIGLPTAALPGFVSAAKSIAQSNGSTNVYVPSGGSLPTTFSCPASAPSYGCIIFYDGSLAISGQQIYNYIGHDVVVINGGYQSTGNSGFSLQPSSASVFVVNGNAYLGGNSDTGALYWILGNISIAGNGNTVGAIVSGGNVIFAGGGSGGGFTCNALDLGLNLNIPSKVTVQSYAEF